MKLTVFIKVLYLVIAGLFISSSASASAPVIEINSGSTLLISGGTLTLACSDVVKINDGGTLDIAGGIVNNLKLEQEGGGSFILSSGSVDKCSQFYIIPTQDGKAIIINL